MNAASASTSTSVPAAYISTRVPGRPFSRDKSDTLLLLAACALVLIPHAAHVPPWIAALCTLLLGWRAWITFRGNRMPPGRLLLPIAAIAMWGVYRSYGIFFGRETGVAMLALLLAFKLLEMRARRDLFVVVFLSFFLVLAQFFESQSIPAAIHALACVVLLLCAQLTFQYTSEVPHLRKRLRLASKVLLLALPLTLALFLLFPRIQGPLWGMPNDAKIARSGLSDTVSPGDVAKLALSGEIVFRAKFPGEPPPSAARYWRGPVLGSFDGRAWTRLPANQPQQPTLALRGTPLRYQVTLEPTGQRALFALEMPAVPQLPGNPVRLTHEQQLLARQPIDERVRYDAVSHPDFALQADESPAAMQRWLLLPGGYNPRTIAFARNLRERHQEPTGIVNEVLQFFREEKFRYTLEPPLLGRDSADEFLFDTRAGFCEHYAGTFAILMRAAGIPARVVTGYQGGELNPVDGFMTVRQSDAHAWTEVWLPQRGWIRVDPTAAVAPERVERNQVITAPAQFFGGLVTIDRERANSLLSAMRRVRHSWDAVNNSWNQWVLDYSSSRQDSLLRTLGFKQPDWRLLATLLIAVCIPLTLVVALLLRGREKIDPLEALYRKLCARLAQWGYPRAPHEGPRAYRERLAAHSATPSAAPSHALAPPRLAAAARFLESYEVARYAPNAAVSHIQLRSLLAECR